MVVIHRARKSRWAPASVLAYLWAGHVAVLSGGTIFHDNYLLGLLPLNASTFIVVVASPSDDRSPLPR